MKLSKKQGIGLVYVGLSLFAIGWAVNLVWAQAQWFNTIDRLEPDVGPVTFAYTPSNSTGIFSLNGNVSNPTGLSVKLLSMAFVVFTNSTTETFLVQGSSEVAASGVVVGQTVTAGGYVNFTTSAPIYSDVVLLLQNFTARHRTDTRVFVLVTLYLRSPFGLFAPRTCLEAPGRIIASCPDRRFSGGGGGGAAGG